MTTSCDATVCASTEYYCGSELDPGGADEHGLERGPLDPGAADEHGQERATLNCGAADERDQECAAAEEDKSCPLDAASPPVDFGRHQSACESRSSGEWGSLSATCARW